MHGLMLVSGSGVFSLSVCSDYEGGAGEFGSSSGGPNHLVIAGPSSDGSRVAASLNVNSPSPSIRSVPNDEASHPSPSQWAPVFLVPGALYVLLFYGIMVAIALLEFVLY
jgi:hypothetical protein